MSNLLPEKQPLPFRRYFSILLPLGLLLLVLIFRLGTWESVFYRGEIYFIDGDCYSRMTRAAMVFLGEALSISRHFFENHPQGTFPHTTGLLDWLIAGFGLLFAILGFGTTALDLAGAWIAPALSAGAICFFWWSRKSESGLWAGVLFLAACPILAHGGALGRPDHQSLQIFLLLIYLCARWRGFQSTERVWPLTAGAALGCALWVSLYEPLVIGALFVVLELTLNHRRFLQRTRLWELGAVFLIFGLTGLIDGFRWSPPSMSDPLFARWSGQIGELNSTRWFSPLLQSWIGWAGYAAAGGAVWLGIRQRDRRLLAFALFWLAMFCLTLWQIRWGYFLGIATAFLVPAVVTCLHPRWLLATSYIVLLLPVWQHWDTTCFPSTNRQEALLEQREEARLLREVALFLKNQPKTDGGILAPWWLSPPLSYWSGLPCLAGSSHQSLPGIEAVARFYLTNDRATAREILSARQVAWVVAYEPARVYSTATPLVGQLPRQDSMATLLFERTGETPASLRLAYVNDFFRLYRVQP